MSFPDGDIRSGADVPGGSVRPNRPRLAHSIRTLVRDNVGREYARRVACPPTSLPKFFAGGGFEVAELIR